MKPIASRFLCICLLWLAWAGAGHAQDGEGAPAASDTAAIAEALAPMTDAEVRRRLIAELASREERAEDEVPMEGGLSTHLLGGIQDISTRLETEFAAIRQAVDGTGREYRIMLRNLTSDEGWPAVAATAGVFLVMIGVGWLAEWGLFRLTGQVRARIRSVQSGNGASRFVYALNRMLLALAGLFLFTLVAYLLSLGFFAQYDPLRVLTMTWLFVIVLVRVARIALNVVLPAGEALVELPPATRRHLRMSVLLVVGTVAILFLHGSLFVLLGMSPALHRAYLLAAGALVLVLAVVLVWLSRASVTVFWQRFSPAGRDTLAGIWVRSWHIPATCLLVVTWLLWDFNVILARPQSAGAALWFLLSIIAGAMARLAINAFARPAVEESADGAAVRTGRSRRLAVPRIATAIAFGLLAFSFLVETVGGRLYAWLATDSGGTVLKGTFSIAVTLVIAWVLWELIRSSIDRYLPEDEAGGAMAFDGEGGEGAPASRAETLLPLLRAFLQFVLVVLVTLTTLSTLGVEIGPLLAGAGVVGLAVGFGAQKLVQDVISGIFFLVDDAFRTGEYIETAEMRGTVEKISVRSLRLRHHLGPVQTIPYSEMATVKNHSRDYIIMKLPFRLPFDTDIEKVRKIIKKIGQEMLADPELGPGFLAPLKSQGVLEMDDSAMVLRMKFTAKPGEQWVIRREAYRRVRDALRKEGIEFANRQVTVHLPGDASQEARNKAIGAAVSQVEEQRQDESDSGDRR